MPVQLLNAQILNLTVMVMVQNVFMAHGNVMVVHLTVPMVLMKLTVLNLVQIKVYGIVVMESVFQPAMYVTV